MPIKFKEVLENTCSERVDILADKVLVRIQGAVSDLHAANARYHKNCLSEFVSERNIKAAKNSLEQTSAAKETFNYILKSIRNKS